MLNISNFFQACYIYCPSYPSWFNHSITIHTFSGLWLEVLITLLQGFTCVCSAFVNYSLILSGNSIRNALCSILEKRDFIHMLRWLGWKAKERFVDIQSVTFMIMLDGVLGRSTRIKMTGNGFPVYLYTATYRTTARQRNDKQVPAETDSW
jgi:hypothetical protein